MTDEHFKTLKYGRFLPLIFDTIPLIFWILYINSVLLPWLRKAKNIGGIKYVIYLSMLLPFIIVILNFYLSNYSGDNTTSIAGWVPCLYTKNITKKNSKNGVVGYWDLKCGVQQLGIINTLSNDFVTRFYYLTHAIFIFILIVYNSVSSDIFKIKHIVYTLVFCLLLGIIGMLPAVYNTYYLKSLLFIRMVSTFLLMDVSAFFILILGILIQIRKHI